VKKKKNVLILQVYFRKKNNKMKKLFLTILFTLVLSGSALSDNHCNENRKDWIKQLKRDLAYDIGDVVYSNNQCFVEILEHNGKSMEEHSYRIAGDKRDDFKDSEERKIRNLFFDIFDNLDQPLNINWVPPDYIPSVHPDYDDGIKYFNKKEYFAAALFLSDFLENNIQHDIAPKAQYLYAETFRLTDDYIEAATQYLTGYEKFIESKFTPLNLMRLGEMMIKIDYPETGCELLNNVQNEAPPVDDDIYLETEQLMKTYKCPKIVTTDEEVMLADLINISKKLFN
jgi:TolA-binding protein